MGNTIGSNLLPTGLSIKRKLMSGDYGPQETETEEESRKPKRQKLMSTSRYIYKTLFEEGLGSDVKITTLNKTWNLHRIYISQSPYFNTMFNGSWVETKQKEIFIGIEDGNITAIALHKVFGSLYQDEIMIESSEVISILASATLLQLDDVIHQSEVVMKENIKMETVLEFYEAAELYGLKDIQKDCLHWLHENLVVKIADLPEQLQKISCELMANLVSSRHLVVIQTEFNLYLILKQWLFLKENPYWKGDHVLCAAAAQKYFEEMRGKVCYLMTTSGQSYQSVFRALRLKHLVVHHVDLEVIEQDQIIPIEWFMPIFKLQWYQMLRVEQGLDKGPRKVTPEEFENECARCGRILQTDAQHIWRWTGFNFGFDLVVYYSHGSFKLRRFPKTDIEPRSYSSQIETLSSQTTRFLMYRLAVYSVNKDGNVIHHRETEIKTTSFSENEQITALIMRSEVTFPILLSANFLMTTPLQSLDESVPPPIPVDEPYV